MTIFLKIADVKGDVTQKKFEHAIAVLGCYAKAECSVDAPDSGRDRFVGRPYYAGSTFNKLLDSSSAVLMQHFYSGEVIPKMEFHHLSSSNTDHCYLIDTFHDVLLSGFERVATADGLIEEIQFDFMQHELRYMGLKNDSQIKAPQSTGYDLKKAVLM